MVVGFREYEKYEVIRRPSSHGGYQKVKYGKHWYSRWREPYLLLNNRVCLLYTSLSTRLDAVSLKKWKIFIVIVEENHHFAYVTKEEKTLKGSDSAH